MPTQGKFRRGTSTQLLGLSDQQMVFLDERTRELEGKYFLDEIAKVNHLPTDFCTLLIRLNNGGLLQFEAEREGVARQIEVYLDNSGQKVLRVSHECVHGYIITGSSLDRTYTKKTLMNGSTTAGSLQRLYKHLTSEKSLSLATVLPIRQTLRRPSYPSFLKRMHPQPRPQPSLPMARPLVQSHP